MGCFWRSRGTHSTTAYFIHHFSPLKHLVHGSVAQNGQTFVQTKNTRVKGQNDMEFDHSSFIRKMSEPKIHM